MLIYKVNTVSAILALIAAMAAKDFPHGITALAWLIVSINAAIDTRKK